MPTKTALSPQERLRAAIARRYPGYKYQDITAIVTNERSADATVWLPFAITPNDHDPWDSNPELLKPAAILEATEDMSDEQLDLNIAGMLEHMSTDFTECYGAR